LEHEQLQEIKELNLLLEGELAQELEPVAMLMVVGEEVLVEQDKMVRKTMIQEKLENLVREAQLQEQII
jgi:hypothetical protein